MCRLFAYLSRSPRPLPADLLRAFAGFAWTGRVGPLEASGHDDGWGLWAVGELGELWLRSCVTLKREIEHYDRLVQQLGQQPTAAALVHLRKSSGSQAGRSNTQPFAHQGLAFAHNGTVFDAQSLACVNPPQGDSDSERLFLFIADRVVRFGFEEGILKALRELRGHSWTALNFVLSDGETLAAYREYDDKRDHVDLRRLYYELHYSVDDGTIVVSSQAIADKNASWQAMPNTSLLIAREGDYELIRPVL